MISHSRDVAAQKGALHRTLALLNGMTFLGAFGPGTEAPVGECCRECRIHFPYI